MWNGTSGFSVAPASQIDSIITQQDHHDNKHYIHIPTLDATCRQPVLCDRTMVVQVLLILARDGVQAMPIGDPASGSGLRVLTLAVSQSRLHSGQSEGGRPRKDRVEFAVTDHGQGLSAEVRDKLFTPFFTPKAEGMGLGLSR